MEGVSLSVHSRQCWRQQPLVTGTIWAGVGQIASLRASHRPQDTFVDVMEPFVEQASQVRVPLNDAATP